jgi:hypothetical protein
VELRGGERIMSGWENLFIVMGVLALFAFFIGFFYACANKDNSIGRAGKPKTLGTFLYLWLECGGSMLVFFEACLGICLLALGLSAPYCVTGV